MPTSWSAACSASKNYLIILHLACFAAFAIQFGNVLEGYLVPRETHVTVTERRLRTFDFPLVIKICVSPGFNISAIHEAGYSKLFNYFRGESASNGSVYGWAGHGGAPRTVEEVVARVRAHTQDQVITRIKVWTMEQQFVNISLDSVRLWRMNYPYNCYSLDLATVREVREMGVKQVFIYFPILANSSVELLLQGSTLACNRDIKSHKFYSSGSNIQLEDLGQPMDKAYVVELRENVYVEEDASKNCRNYPTPEFASYRDCDDHFMKDFISTFDPPDLVPIWLTDDLRNVTSRAFMRSLEGEQGRLAYGDMWDGTQVGRARQNGDHSDHRSRKVLIFDGKFYLNFTRFCLHFDGKRVFVTETNILLLTI